MTRYCDKECRDNAACSDACKGDEVSESTLNDVLCGACGKPMKEVGDIFLGTSGEQEIEVPLYRCENGHEHYDAT